MSVSQACAIVGHPATGCGGAREQENNRRARSSPRCCWIGNAMASPTRLAGLLDFFFKPCKGSTWLLVQSIMQSGGAKSLPLRAVATALPLLQQPHRNSKATFLPRLRKCVEGRSLIKKQPSQQAMEQKFSWTPAASSSCYPCQCPALAP